MKIIDVYNFLNSIAPFSLAMSWDNCGLLIGNKLDEVHKALVCLDVTDTIIDECVLKKCNLLISHHPIIFNGLKSIESDTLVYKLIKNNINAISLHTNLDIAQHGVNYALANTLELDDCQALSSDVDSIGLVGRLKSSYNPNELAKFVKKRLNCKKISYISGHKNIHTVAVCGGAGANMTKLVIHKNIDAYITSEIKYNIWLEAKTAGLTLIDAGHFNTENPVCDVLVKHLNNYFKTDNFNVAQNNIDIIEAI